jgi:AraC family transcriptional activator of mtrCDE
MLLERLLDGLDVTVDPLVVSGDRHGRPPGCQADEPSLRVTLDGRAVFELAGGATLCVSRHRVVVVPPHPRGLLARGRGRSPTAPARSARARLSSRAPAVGMPDAVRAWGQVHATYQGTVGVFDHLREPLIERLAADDPLRGALQELLDELIGQQPGYRAMVEALVRRWLILLLRRLCDHDGQRLSWLALLEDSRLGRVVTAMQDRPEHSFTLPALAEVAGMSRSVFAARFAGALGQPPIEFLKRLRLARAARLLVGTDLPVKSVATRVGYSSRSSFTRAFVTSHGVGPTAFRVAGRERRASA